MSNLGSLNCNNFSMPYPNLNNLNLSSMNSNNLSLSSWNQGSYNWGSNTGFGWGSVGGYSSSGSSSNATTIDEVDINQKKEYEKYKDVWAKLLVQEKETNAQLEALKEAKIKLAKSKNADGTATIVKDLDEMSFGQKLGRGVLNAFNGLGNLCKSLVGFDKDGKWNPIKCLRNVAIAVGMAVVCVYAAPVAVAVAAKLGASAATAATVGAVAKGALVTAPAVAALGGGIGTAGKGIYDACNAETTEEFDKATQSVGQCTAVAIASCVGLKSMSASAGLASSGLKGTLVHPFKAGMIEAEAAVSSMSAAATSAGANSIKNLGFFKSVGAGRNGIKNLHADVKMNDFNTSLDKTKNSLQESLAELEIKINSATNAKEKALLEMQYNTTKTYFDKLDRAASVSDWKELCRLNKEINKQTNPYKWYTKGSTQYQIDGQTFTKAELKAINSSTKNISSSVTDIAKQKFNVMSKVAGTSNYANDVANFGMSNKWYAQPYNWGYAKYQQGITMRQLFGAAMTLTAPVYALQPTLNNPMMSANNIAILVDPCYEKSSGDLISKEEVDTQEAEFKKDEETLSKKAIQLKTQKQELTNA